MSNTQIATQNQKTGIASYLGSDAVKNNIAGVIGEKNITRFISSVVSAVQVNPTLAQCTNPSILSAALQGEALQLAPSPQLGQFYMVPYDKKEREDILQELKEETRTIILYEAPHHLKKTLQECRKYLGNRQMTVCKELTKKYENKLLGTLDEIIAFYEENEPRGEYVLIFEGKSRQELKEEAQEKWMELSLPAHMDLYLQQGVDRKEAMKLVAKDRGISKREVYNALLKIK